jgi:hypothetical protein
MSAELVPIPPRDLARTGLDRLPAAIGRAGEAAAWRFIEFFVAMIRNKNGIWICKDFIPAERVNVLLPGKGTNF